MGMFAYFRGRWNEAIELYQQGHDLRLKIGDTVDRPGLISIGEILSDQGRLEEAEATFRDVLRVWTAAGRKEFIALTTSDLARVASRSGGRSKPWTCSAMRSGCSRRSATTARCSRRRCIAECLMLEGAVTQALAACDGSPKRAPAIGAYLRKLPMLNRVKGWSLIQAGRLEDAGRAFEESLEAARSRQAGIRDRAVASRQGRARRPTGRGTRTRSAKVAPSSSAWASFASPASRPWQPPSVDARTPPLPGRAPRGLDPSASPRRVTAVPPQLEELTVAVRKNRLRAHALGRVGDARRGAVADHGGDALVVALHVHGAALLLSFT